jgi:hypothetical protein
MNLGLPCIYSVWWRDKPPSRDELETTENKFEGIPLKILHIGNGRVNFVSFVTRMVAEEGDDEII